MWWGPIGNKVVKSTRTSASCNDLTRCIIMRHCRVIHVVGRRRTYLPRDISSQSQSPLCVTECEGQEVSGSVQESVRAPDLSGVGLCRCQQAVVVGILPILLRMLSWAGAQDQNVRFQKPAQNEHFYRLSCRAKFLRPFACGLRHRSETACCGKHRRLAANDLARQLL